MRSDNNLHGLKEYEKAVRISEALFSGNVKNLTLEEINDGFKDVPATEIKSGTTVLDFIVDAGIASSKREGREFIN